MNALTWSAQDAPVAIVMLTVSIAYVLYHYAAQATRFQRVLEARGWDAPAAHRTGVLLQRSSGALLLGVLPALVAALTLPGGIGARGLAAVDPGPTLLGVLLGAVLLLPILWIATRGDTHQARYPLIRSPHWDLRLRIENALGWAAYLLGYELFFRGFLLFSLAMWMGPWPAILITTALYTYAHLPKDAGECAGCVVMGVVFGALALGTGAIWAPFLLHLVIALASDTFTVHHARKRLIPSAP